MKKLITLTSLLVGASLVGCSSTDEIIEQQAQQQEQINMLTSKADEHEQALTSQSNALTHMSEAGRELFDDVGELKSHYIVKQNDTLNSIAREFGIPVEYLESLNPDLDPEEVLKVGQSLNIK